MQFDFLSDLAIPPRSAPPHASAPARTPLQRLLDAALEQLPSAAPFRTPGQAVTWATHVTGVPYAAGGAWSLDDAYDAVEGAAHRHLGTALRGSGFRDRLALARSREDEWFHGRPLTEAARALAQFSTPLPIAEGAAHLIRSAAGLRTVLEPCAGTGSLLRPLLDSGNVGLSVNELDARRREVLAWLGLQPAARDALRMPLEPLRVDAVLSNPPFGAVVRGYAGRGACPFPLTNIAQRFAAAHMGSLRSSAVLVALLPASTFSDAGAGFRRWLGETHTPVLYLGCPAASYRTRGALRDAMLLVALAGAVSAPPERLVIANPTWDEWADAIDVVAAHLAERFPARHASTDEEPAAPAVMHLSAASTAKPTVSTAARHATEAVAEEMPAACGGAATDAVPGQAPHTAADEADPEDVADGAVEELAAHAAPAATEQHAPLAARAQRGARPPTTVPIDFTGPAPERAVPDWERVAREREEAGASRVFTPFVCSLAQRRAPHPRLVVQTRSMAGMAPPPLVRQTFASALADDAWGRAGATGGASDEQAELSLRILDAWDRGHGFLCADDVGVGKSRELALLVLEAIQEGERRILVTTKNETNVRDLEAELRRVASGDEHGPFPAELIEVANYAEAKEDGVLPLPAGPAVYLAHSYNFAAFVSAIDAVRPTVWLADEAHEFGNIATSRRGLAWAALHESMLAYTSKFAYFTATPALSLDQLCYLYGLRQWKVGAFDVWIAQKTGTGEAQKPADTAAAAAAVQAHVAASTALGDTAGIESDQSAKEGKLRFMARRNDAFTIRTTPAETEQVMRELQASGHYMSRDLWRGGVSFEIEWIDLLHDPEARRRYDEAAALCRDLTLASRQFGSMNEEVQTAGLDRAMIQSYLKQCLFDLRLDSVLARADVALAEGHQVVISVHSVAGDDEPIEALGSDAQELPVTRRLESAINRINVREVKKERTSEGETVYRDLGEIPEALLARESLRERARALPRLRDPVRVVTQHFGAPNVAAITGRIPARLRTQRMGEFQAGGRRVALISRAGKVGISLHDTGGRRRTMLVADYEWSADTFKQELGRVDRTGQLSFPSLVLMASTAAGERRFAATIAARMASLGATCKGSAEATGTDALDVFDMAGGIALEAMRDAVASVGDEQRSYFTGSQFLEEQMTKEGATIWVPKPRPDPSTEMRHFLLEMLLFPMEQSHLMLSQWEHHRDLLLTEETRDALAARRTNKARGVVVRERGMPVQPALSLIDVQFEDGELGVIAQGYVTEHMVRIQRARGPDSKGGPRTRRYVQFTANDGRLISGLELTPSEAARVRWVFGSAQVRDLTPEALLQDLHVGEKPALKGAEGARWVLHLRRDGRIEIRGAKLGRDRLHLMRDSLQGAVAYEPAGNFFYLTSDAALTVFTEHFPPAEPSVALPEAA